MRLFLRNILIYLCIAFFVSLSGSAAAQGQPAGRRLRPSDLEGRTWHIVSYFNREIYLKFENGVVVGSPGCGRFTGIYRKSGEQLMVSIEWSDRKETPCDDEEREEARRVREALIHVQRIQVEPPDRQWEFLDLADAEGAILIILAPMQAGADLSELEGTFWHLEQLYGSHADFSRVIINIRGRTIDFTTPSYYTYFPFTYRWAGLEFTPDYPRLFETKDSNFSQDQQIVTEFKNTLHKIQSYELSQGRLVFFDKNRQTIIVLRDFRKEGIENRRWRIAKYRGNGTQPLSLACAPDCEFWVNLLELFPGLALKIAQSGPADKDGLVDAHQESQRAQLAEITFLNGQVVGSPGCGAWWGRYTLSGDRLTVKASLSLFGTCEAEGFAQDYVVENALKGDLRVVRKNDGIILRDNSGQARILLVPY